jgi:hypothetical protein
MSYCRFSSDNWKSDVYTYEHCDGGFVTHVAGRKRTFPPIPDIPLSWIPRFGGEFSIAARRVTYPTRWHSFVATCSYSIYGLWHRLSMWSVGVIPLKDIGLPHDGAAFNDDTASECADRLESLRALGYHVPQSAINALREEAKEAAQ